MDVCVITFPASACELSFGPGPMRAFQFSMFEFLQLRL